MFSQFCNSTTPDYDYGLIGDWPNFFGYGQITIVSNLAFWAVIWHFEQ
jgi:hypothetical protein